LKLPRLKEVRELHGWSQAKLAEESGVSRDSISNYETGQREAWPATAKKLADALGVEIADLREPARELAVSGKAEAPRGAGHAVLTVGATPEEAAEKLERQLYAPAEIARGWHRLAQRWGEQLERGDFDTRSLEVLVDTLEDVALGMEANVAAERKELRARYDNEDAVRRMAVLRPAIDRLSALVGEALRKIDAEQREVEAGLANKLVRLDDHFKRAS
jgi:transcriptional regulator with XRE-family HTH domain